MKDLKAKIEDGKLSAMSALTPLKQIPYRAIFALDFDYDVSQYQKGQMKEYFFRGEIDFSDACSYCASVEVEDAGYDLHGSGELSNTLSSDDVGALKYKERSSSPRMKKISIEGTANLSSLDFGIVEDVDCVVQLQIFGIEPSESLSIFQELLLEAFALEVDGNKRVAFFTYFTALEALVASRLDTIKASLFSELHNALEHLSLDEKLRVIFKHYPGKSVDTNPIYSQLLGLLQTVKAKRNDLAHGKSVVKVNDSDVVDVFAVFCTLYTYTEWNLASFVDIRRKLYPKKK